MGKKSILPILLVPVVILLVLWVAMQLTGEMGWDAFDFMVAWTLMTGVGLAYKLATRRAGSLAYRAATCIALAAAFILIWMNLAVGLIGSEDHPANLMYGGVLAICATGAIIARLQPRGMARALFATALAQFLVPVIALIIWKPPMTVGVAKVFVLNAFFVLLFAASAMLFLRAALKNNGRRVETTP
jgi:hypothetical protein